MASNAFAGVGTRFQRWNGTLWQTIAEVNAIEGPGMTKDVLEVTSLDTDAGYNEFITGFAEGGTLTLDMNFTRDTYELMKDDFESDIVRTYRIQLPDFDDEPSTFTIEGLVIELPITMMADDKVTADVTIQITSEVLLAVGSTTPEPPTPEIPVRQSQRIENATPTILRIIYNRTLASTYVPAASAFSVVVAGGARAVSSVAISGTQVMLTLASAVTSGQAVTVAYSKPAVNPIQTPQGGQAASFGAVTVANNVLPEESSAAETYGIITSTKYAIATGLQDFGGDASDNAGYIEVRFYHTQATRMELFFVGWGDHSQVKMQLYTTTDNQLYFRLWDSTVSINNRLALGGGVLLTTGWHVIRIISNGSSYTMILDGSSVTIAVIDGSNDGAWLADITHPLNTAAIGVNYAYSKTYSDDGYHVIDYVDYNNEHYWDLNGNTGTLVDSIGNINLTWS